MRVDDLRIGDRPMKRAGTTRTFLLGLLGLLVAACGGGGSGPTTRSGYVTADPRGLSGALPGGAGGGAPLAPAPGAAAADAAEDIGRAIEEADLYRVDGDRLYLLNSWRGLAVVDLATPALLGRLAMTGVPREMFVRGSHAYVMLAGFDGGTQVLDVSIATPAAPVLLGTFPLAGSYRTSRIVGNVLYVLTDVAAHSFLAAGALSAVATLPIPGGAAFAHATDAFLFVAADDGAGDTRVTWVDISSPVGAMTLRGSKTFPGTLSDPEKLHFGAGTLRVVTHDRTNGGLSHLFVVDVSVPDAPVTRGTLELARGEQLFATRFTDEAAFLVTFEQVDPLWVIDLRNPDAPSISGSLTVPGWSTHLLALAGRLVALGRDPSDWHATASLFDVSDPTHPTMRSRVDFGWGWSSAFEDVKGFGVFESDGLVLVPFAGERNELTVLGLSPTALSLRGSFGAEGTVVRGFPHARGLCAISTEEVVLANPATLAVTGRVTIAENVADVLRLPDGRLVQGIRRSTSCRVGGVDLPMQLGRMFPFGESVAVTGGDDTGSAAYVIDFATTPATVSPRLDLGTWGGLPMPVERGWGMAAPVGVGMWGWFGASDGVLSSDGRLALHTVPSGAADVTVGTGAIADGFVVLDVPGARIETSIAVRGGFVTGFVADQGDLVFTFGSFAGNDGASRPLLLHDLVRVDLAAHTASAPVNVPGLVVAAQGDRVFTHEETWGSGWSCTSSLVASDVVGGVVTLLDRLPLPDGSYDLRAAGATLWLTTYGGLVPMPGGGGGSPPMGGPMGVGSGMDMPFMPSADIRTVRLGATLTFGPTIAYDADFASLLLPEEGGALVVRNGVSVDRWNVTGPAAVLVGSSDVGAWPESARPDTAPGTYLLALGYGGFVTVP